MPFLRRKSRQQSDQAGDSASTPQSLSHGPKAVFPLRLTDDCSTTELANIHETAHTWLFYISLLQK